MQLRQLFKNAFAVYTKNFGKLFAPLLILQLALLLPLLLFTMPATVNMARALLASSAAYAATGEGIPTVYYVLIYMLLALLFISPLVVSNTVFVIDQDSKNEAVTFRRSFRFSRGNYGSMLKSYFACIVASAPLFFALFLQLARLFGRRAAAAMPVSYVLTAVVVAALLMYILGTVFLPYVVVSENERGFSALTRSFRYIYRGNFWANLSRLAIGAGIVGLLVYAVNWLSQLPFRELFDLYLADPAAALREPLMVFAILLSIAAIVLVALIMPFWYAFSYHTYLDARVAHAKKYAMLEKES
jgi:hypothetical protein